MTENPYEAPQAFDPLPQQTSDAESIRNEHIKTEASIKSIGILYYLGSIIIFIVAIGTVLGENQRTNPWINYGIAGLLFGLGILQFFTATAVRKFKPWSRIAVGILSGIGLLKLPVGPLISAYILFTVFGKKGQMVFSEPYKEVIAATPHIKYKTSKLLLIVLAIIVVLLVAIVVAYVTPRR